MLVLFTAHGNGCSDGARRGGSGSRGRSLICKSPLTGSSIGRWNPFPWKKRYGTRVSWGWRSLSLESSHLSLFGLYNKGTLTERHSIVESYQVQKGRVSGERRVPPVSGTVLYI